MRTIATFILAALFSTTRPCVAASAPRVGVLEWAAAQREHQYHRVPHEVLAFYYTWYGRPDRHGHWVHWGGENVAAHEIPASTHYPSRGAYDSQDPDLVKAHIVEAKANGVTGFIATWWGQGTYEDRSLELLMSCAETNNFKVSVYWEKAPGNGDTQVDQAVDDLIYVIRRYGSRPSFLKVKGVPVVFVYGRVMNQVPLDSWPTILTRVRAEVGPVILIADGYRESFARLFDGVHTYNICAQVAGKSPTRLRTWSAGHYADAVRLARECGRISCVTVIPGYDDTKIRKPGLHAARQDGQTYRVLWEEAMKANADWVLITSWNEWHEGSEIEPSWENGDQYLKLTRDYALRFLSRDPVSTTIPPASAITNEQRQQLQALFQGKTIGVLPGFGDAAFWLLDAGLDVRELTWEQVVDPGVLNPRNLPVLLHAGDEHYTSRVHEDGDVVRSLQHYLTAGGFLVVMPYQPFPFYYDDTSGKAAPVAHQVGLPVEQGWETPPSNATLSFRFDTNALPGLGASVPFPKQGDVRWRPAQRLAADPRAHYLALATLLDGNGESQGQGMVYVSHVAPPLAGGQILYVWMRMADAVGADELRQSVFCFVGEHLHH